MGRINQTIDQPTKKINRLTSRMPNKGLYWCDKCDRNAIGDGEKCKVCGYQNRKPMHKSDIP